MRIKSTDLGPKKFDAMLRLDYSGQQLGLTTQKGGAALP
jgi:hypothetical protein